MFFYDGNTLHIGSYLKVLCVNQDNIRIKLSKIIINIIGECLRIISLNDSEMYIQGKIYDIELVDVNE